MPELEPMQMIMTRIDELEKKVEMQHRALRVADKECRELVNRLFRELDERLQRVYRDHDQRISSLEGVLVAAHEKSLAAGKLTELPPAKSLPSALEYGQKDQWRKADREFHQHTLDELMRIVQNACCTLVDERNAVEKLNGILGVWQREAKIFNSLRQLIQEEAGVTITEHNVVSELQKVCSGLPRWSVSVLSSVVDREETWEQLLERLSAQDKEISELISFLRKDALIEVNRQNWVVEFKRQLNSLPQ